MNSIKLYLIPNLLGESSLDVLSNEALNIIPTLKSFVVENLKVARRFLRKVDKTFDIDGSCFLELTKDISVEDQIGFINYAIEHQKDIGIISDAGMPGIADPGEEFIELAHGYDLQVVPLTGPSSILLALVASGLNAEKFEFVGYLPIQRNDRQKAIKKIEQESLKSSKSILFMETPYRNNQLFESLIQTLNNNTLLCVASNISLADEFIKTRSIKNWKKNTPNLHKKPSVFVLQA